MDPRHVSISLGVTKNRIRIRSFASNPYLGNLNPGQKNTGCLSWLVRGSTPKPTIRSMNLRFGSGSVLFDRIQIWSIWTQIQNKNTYFYWSWLVWGVQDWGHEFEGRIRILSFESDPDLVNLNTTQKKNTDFHWSWLVWGSTPKPWIWESDPDPFFWIGSRSNLICTWTQCKNTDLYWSWLVWGVQHRSQQESHE